MDKSNDCTTLKRELGLFEVFCIASGAMISSGLFVLPGLAYAKTGASVIISYLIASLLIVPTLLSKAELATAMPKAGGDWWFCFMVFSCLKNSFCTYWNWCICTAI